MMKEFLHEVRAAVAGTLVLGILACGVYPLLVWGIARGVFPDRAGSSLIIRNGEIIGSRLIAQGFSGDQYFHPRPSAAGTAYDAAGSGGSNLGPLSGKLMSVIGKRAAEYRRENGLRPGTPVPADAVTASASGLDPHISPENAFLQISRVARARNMGEETVRGMVEAHIEGYELGVLGEPRVNVLMLNLDMDGIRGGE